MSKEEKTVIVDFETLDPHTQKIILAAITARKKSYSPYSNFPVGACIEVENGTLYHGCNVENAVYPLCICAERTAGVKAVSDGHTKFKTIAVIGDQKESFTTPCGSCRQFLAEFNPKMRIFITRSSLGEVLCSTIEQLLPYNFHL